MKDTSKHCAASAREATVSIHLGHLLVGSLHHEAVEASKVSIQVQNCHVLTGTGWSFDVVSKTRGDKPIFELVQGPHQHAISDNSVAGGLPHRVNSRQQSLHLYLWVVPRTSQPPRSVEVPETAEDNLIGPAKLVVPDLGLLRIDVECQKPFQRRDIIPISQGEVQHAQVLGREHQFLVHLEGSVLAKLYLVGVFQKEIAEMRRSGAAVPTAELRIIQEQFPLDVAA